MSWAIIGSKLKIYKLNGCFHKTINLLKLLTFYFNSSKVHRRFIFELTVEKWEHGSCPPADIKSIRTTLQVMFRLTVYIIIILIGFYFVVHSSAWNKNKYWFVNKRRLNNIFQYNCEENWLWITDFVFTGPSINWSGWYNE